ncbi:MAG: phenylalanine--tRNA ligase subunit beta [Candidatus Paceibacterota bacterium]|jgi:phenylalanyl-tRNA synthetase beta chain
MLISYKWIKEYVKDLPEANKLQDIFNYHLCEVEGIEEKDGDTIFDLNILPNRAHDLLCHQGIARELAGQLGLKFELPEYKKVESTPTNLKIDVIDGRRYMGRIIRNIEIKDSPDWVKKHLETIGQRPIVNMVDATNIVLFDAGQPCHVFDLDKVKGAISIRKAKTGEQITTLDNKEVLLTEEDIIIADEEGPLAIAGIKGGKKAEVDENTKNIIIEVANFYPTLVRKTSRRLGILTDASKRYENDLSAELCDFTILQLSALISEMCPQAEFEEIVDEYKEKQKETKISFSTDLINKKLGTKISTLEIENILKNYNFEYKNESGDFEIISPSLRLDLVIPEDMVEEIGRIYGYDKVNPEIPKISFTPRINETFAKISWARNKLLTAGYSEVMTYTFCDRGEVGVLASASDKKFLRTNLTDGLKESLKMNQLNAPFLGMNEIKIFEIGTVFFIDHEEIHVAYNDKEKIIEQKLDDFCKDFSIPDSYGNLIPDLNLENIEKFKPWSVYPFITRDIAVWIPENDDSEKLKKILIENGTELLIREPKMFDSFTKEGRTSYAFKLVFQSKEKTLTDGEINSIMDKITENTEKQAGWKVR